MTKTIQMTQGQYKRKTAYHIDPLMADAVEVVEPDFFHRLNGELEAHVVMKEIRKTKALSKQKKNRLGLVLMIALLCTVIPYSGNRTVTFANAATVVNTTVKPGDANLRVALVQQRLHSFGYSVKVDGIYGPQTLRAVVNFQHVNGLQTYGVIDSPTQKALGISFTYSNATRIFAPAPIHRVYPDRSTEQWYTTAIRAGWSPSQWPVLACIIHRESNGQPGVRNRWSDATGLLQILARYSPGVNLYDPLSNLSAGLRLYHIRGWQPWSLPGNQCY